MISNARTDRHATASGGNTIMIAARLAVLLTLIGLGLRRRVDRLRAEPDRGGHAVEYAIGIGGSAVVILGVIAALKSGLANVIKSWVFK